MRPKIFSLLTKSRWQRWTQLTSPYGNLVRLSKPTGVYLLYLPCTWSILMASQQTSCLLPPTAMTHTLALFGVGAWIMRGAGCTINDLWDQRFDAKVKRTVTRPLPSGELTRNEAYQFLVAQLSAGLIVLLQLNWTSIFLGASSLLLVGTYPLMKRITFYPQLFLGLTFNWGALLGFTAINETLPLYAWPLYLGGIGWTLIYDTIYAHQDKKDDVLIGVKSTALKFQDRTPLILTWISVGTSLCWASAGYLAQLPWPYYIGLSGAMVNLLWVSNTTNIHDPKACAQGFQKSVYAGVFLSCGLGLSYLKKCMESCFEEPSLTFQDDSKTEPSKLSEPEKVVKLK